MSDVELGQKVSNWIFASSEFQYQNHFISYSVDFANGKARILPKLQEDFKIWKTLNHFNTDEEALAGGIYGRTMFKNRKFGNCTFSATLQATVLKALGIPTRLVLMVPVIDWNDQTQWNLVRSNIHQLDIQKTILDGLGRNPVGG